MIKKDNTLAYDFIKIRGYKYKESKIFPQENPNNEHNGVCKEHKFIIDTKGKTYALEFLRRELYDKDTILSEMEAANNDILIVKKFIDHDILNSKAHELLLLANCGHEYQIFKELLTEISILTDIGCPYEGYTNQKNAFNVIGYGNIPEMLRTTFLY